MKFCGRGLPTPRLCNLPYCSAFRLFWRGGGRQFKKKFLLVGRNGVLRGLRARPWVGQGFGAYRAADRHCRGDRFMLPGKGLFYRGRRDRHGRGRQRGRFDFYRWRESVDAVFALTGGVIGGGIAAFFTGRGDIAGAGVGSASAGSARRRRLRMTFAFGFSAT